MGVFFPLVGLPGGRAIGAGSGAWGLGVLDRAWRTTRGGAVGNTGVTESDRCHWGLGRQRGDLIQAETLVARPGGWGAGVAGLGTCNRGGRAEPMGHANVPAVWGDRKSVWGSGWLSGGDRAVGQELRGWKHVGSGTVVWAKPTVGILVQAWHSGVSGRAEEEMGSEGHWVAIGRLQGKEQAVGNWPRSVHRTKGEATGDAEGRAAAAERGRGLGLSSRLLLLPSPYSAPRSVGFSACDGHGRGDQGLSRKVGVPGKCG